jgi:hypothetical protein
VGGTAAHADLVVVSYVIGELEPQPSPASPATPGRSPTTRSRSIEPGTTAGYERVLDGSRRR